MAIARFDPFRDMAVLQDRMSRLLGDAYAAREEGVLSNWVPAVDIFENDKKELVIKVELPDVNREDVSVTVENNTLTLSGERRMDSEVKKEHYHRIERAYGSFSRSFSLPATVDSGKIGAEFKNGVLTVRLPFREEAKPRSINIAVTP
ncbi:MAG: Hsp20/alpha crystallin family protein [Acidobacteriota bacterium]|jgi:HSP20 family protein|nr:Hsp20/alpha crystallin family protein [Acidobacteriota bacterium]